MHGEKNLATSYTLLAYSQVVRPANSTKPSMRYHWCSSLPQCACNLEPSSLCAGRAPPCTHPPKVKRRVCTCTVVHYCNTDVAAAESSTGVVAVFQRGHSMYMGMNGTIQLRSGAAVAAPMMSRPDRPSLTALLRRLPEEEEEVLPSPAGGRPPDGRRLGRGEEKNKQKRHG